MYTQNAGPKFDPAIVQYVPKSLYPFGIKLFWNAGVQIYDYIYKVIQILKRILHLLWWIYYPLGFSIKMHTRIQ